MPSPAQRPQERARLTDMAALGLGSAPEFDGADDRRLVPFVLADLNWNGVGIQWRGQRVQFDLLGGGAFRAGPVLNVRLPREDADGVLGLLPDIDTAIEAGGFVGYRFGGDASGVGQISLELAVLRDVSDAHDGFVATAQAGVAAIRRGRWFADLDLHASFADSHYLRTYFGITAQDAETSGLSAFRPDAGIRDVGTGVSFGYQFDARWGVIGRIGVSRYLGDAGDSPVTDAGERTPWQAGIAVSRRF